MRRLLVQAVRFPRSGQTHVAYSWDDGVALTWCDREGRVAADFELPVEDVGCARCRALAADRAERLVRDGRARLAH